MLRNIIKSRFMSFAFEKISRISLSCKLSLQLRLMREIFSNGSSPIPVFFTPLTKQRFYFSLDFSNLAITATSGEDVRSHSKKVAVMAI